VVLTQRHQSHEPKHRLACPFVIWPLGCWAVAIVIFVEEEPFKRFGVGLVLLAHLVADHLGFPREFVSPPELRMSVFARKSRRILASFFLPLKSPYNNTNSYSHGLGGLLVDFPGH
jgi:hypothetical protein